MRCKVVRGLTQYGVLDVPEKKIVWHGLNDPKVVGFLVCLLELEGLNGQTSPELAL